MNNTNLAEQLPPLSDHEALVEASRQLGWTVQYDLPAGIPHVVGMPRPVDIRIVDPETRKPVGSSPTHRVQVGVMKRGGASR